MEEMTRTERLALASARNYDLAVRVTTTHELMLSKQIEMLKDALHAFTHSAPNVTEEFLNRVINEFESTLNKLRSDITKINNQ